MREQYCTGQIPLGGSLVATRVPVCVDVLVLCAYVALCTSTSWAHVFSDMCVHAHLPKPACGSIKKAHASGCEIKEWKRGPSFSEILLA